MISNGVDLNIKKYLLNNLISHEILVSHSYLGFLWKLANQTLNYPRLYRISFLLYTHKIYWHDLAGKAYNTVYVIGLQ